MDIEVCKNCKCTIGPLEQAFVCNGRIVCSDCNQLLQNSSNNVQKKATEHTDSFDSRSELGMKSNRISVTEEDFLVAGGEASNITESQTTHGSDKLDSLSAKPVSESNLFGQEPLRITPEDFKPVLGSHEPTITIGPEDFRESPASQSELTKQQEMPPRTKSIRVEESDFIAKPAVKSIAKEAGKAAGLSIKAKVLTFMIVTAAGGGAFVAYEGGLTQAKTEVNYFWTKLGFSAGSASPEQVCKMYLLACWKGDRSTATSLLTQDTRRVMADAERQQDQWRREQVERLRGRRLSDKEWSDLKAEVANAEPQLAAMFEGTEFNFRFGQTRLTENTKATVEMQAQMQMKGPLFDNWQRMMKSLSQADTGGAAVSRSMERFWEKFGSRWWGFKFFLISEGGAWKIDDIELPIGEMMESLFDSFE